MKINTIFPAQMNRDTSRWPLPVWEGNVLQSFPTHGFGPNYAPHSTHAQGHSWMSSNQFAASTDVLPSHHASKANAPSIHTSASHIVPQPHLAVLSQLSSSPSSTRKLTMDVHGESVLHALFAIDRRRSKSSGVLIPWIRSSRSSLIQGECLRLGGDPITNSGRSACNVFQHSCRPAAEAKSHPNRKSTTAPWSSLNALPSFADIQFCHVQRTQLFDVFAD